MKSSKRRSKEKQNRSRTGNNDGAWAPDNTDSANFEDGDSVEADDSNDGGSNNNDNHQEMMYQGHQG